MKKTILSIIIVTLSIANVSEAVELDVPYHPQNTMVWCWAAAVAMVGDYVNGTRTEDCEVLSAYDRMLGGRGLCCQGDPACLRTGMSGEVVSLLQNIYGLRGRHYTRALTFDEIRNEIDHNNPIIAALRRWNGGHVVVIIGYEPPRSVILLDPMRYPGDPSPRHVVTYDSLRQNFQLGDWSESFTVVNTNADDDDDENIEVDDDDDDDVNIEVDDNDDDDLGYYCCDMWGNRACRLMAPMVPGSACVCFNIPGVGAACK